MDLAAAILAVLLDQGRAQIVAPGPRRADEPSLDLRDVVVVGNAVFGVDDVTDPREQRFGQLQRPVDMGAAERLDQDPGDALAILGVEAITRDADQAFHETIQRVAQRRTAALAGALRD